MPAIGTNGHDILTGDASSEIINGLDGSDLIEAGAGSDTVNGGDGDDAVVGGEGADVLNGGDGSDVLISGGLGGQSLEEVLTIDPSIGYMYFNYSVLLGAGDDGAVDTLNGGDGDDSVFLGLGDSANGGDGVDSITGLFGSRGSGLTLDLRGDANAALGAALGGSVTNFEIFGVIGTNFADTIYAHSAGSMLFGGGGVDTLVGGAGDDYLDGSAGAYDPVSGAPLDDGAADTLTGGGGDDAIFLGLNDSGDGGSGADFAYINLAGSGSGVNLTVGAGAEHTAYGAALGGSLSGFESFNLITTQYADTITLLGSLTQSVNSGAGADTINLVANGSYTSVFGGDGADQITVTAGSGTTLLYGGSGADTITGGAGTDVIDHGQSGGAGVGLAAFDDGAADVIASGGGADQVSIGMGDSADGGASTDTLTVYFAAAGSGRTVDLSVNASASLGAAVGGTIANFESYRLYGSNHADSFTAGSAAVTFVGGYGADTLIGGNGADTIHDGFDASYSLAITDDYQSDFRGYIDDGAADTINAGGGADRVYIGLGDSADGGAGTDILNVHFVGRGSGINLNLSGNANTALGAALGSTIANFEEFYVAGSNHADTIVGGATTTAIYGLDGDDAITIGTTSFLSSFYATIGGAGADTITGNAMGNAIVTGEAGMILFSIDDEEAYEGHADLDVDVVSAGGGADTILAGYGDDIDGGADIDTLHLYLSGATSGVTINMTGGGNAGVSAGTGATIQNIEQFHIHGSKFNDVITGDATLQAVYGHAGNDTITIVSGIAEGGDGNDTLTTTSVTGSDLLGNDGNDTLNGGTGSDSLEGGDGDDTINAGAGHDYIEGGDGDDVITAGAGDDAILAGYGTDSIDGGDGLDVVDFEGPLSSYTVSTVGGVTTVTGAQGVTTITNVEEIYFNGVLYGPAPPINGTSGNDNLVGTANADTINGLGGDDTLRGGAGGDALDGGTGIDTASYAGSDAGVIIRLQPGGAVSGGHAEGDTLTSIENAIGSSFDDILIGSKGAANRLEGGKGDDQIDGQSGNDILLGDAGNDRLIGGAGADVLDGGAGADTAYYNGSASGVTVRLNTGVGSGGDAAGDTYTSIEHAAGSAFNDTLIGDNVAGNRLDGGNGNDYLDGLAGNDVLLGGAGDDRLVGGEGGDRMDGGSGIDTVYYHRSSAAVTVRLQSGGAVSGGEAAGDVINNVENAVGSSFGDTLIGSKSIANRLEGGDGNDYLDGLSGNDVLLGGNGDDRLVGGDGNDAIDGGAGVDTAIYAGASSGVTVRLFNGTATGGAGEDTLGGVENVTGSAFSDSLLGSDGVANTLRGEDGNDFLNGFSGDDALIGGAGNDTLVGGLGADTLDGGAGLDVYQFNSALGGGNIDQIVGFSVLDDTIQIDDAVFTGGGLTAGALAASAFTTGSAATTAAHRIVYNSTTGQLFYDADGSGAGAAILFATLDTGLGLTAADFVVI